MLNCSYVCASADTCLGRNSVILTDYGDLKFHISHRQVDQGLHLTCVNEVTPVWVGTMQSVCHIFVLIVT